MNIFTNADSDDIKELHFPFEQDKNSAEISAEISALN